MEWREDDEASGHGSGAGRVQAGGCLKLGWWMLGAWYAVLGEEGEGREMSSVWRSRRASLVRRRVGSWRAGTQLDLAMSPSVAVTQSQARPGIDISLSLSLFSTIMAAKPPLFSAPLRALRAVALVLPWLAYLLLVDALLSLLLPFKLFAPTAVFNASSVLAESVWAWIQAIFTRFNRARILVSANCQLPRAESAIVISNHVAWSDFYMIQQLASQQGMLGRCRWFAKRSLRWVPFLGWGLWAMGMPLVSRRWTTDRVELDKVFRGIITRRWPICTYPTCRIDLPRHFPWNAAGWHESAPSCAPCHVPVRFWKQAHNHKICHLT